jgi:hypothetical protein
MATPNPPDYSKQLDALVQAGLLNYIHAIFLEQELLSLNPKERFSAQEQLNALASQAKLLAETQDIEKANELRKRLGMPLLPTGPEQRKALQSDIANILQRKLASDLVPLTPQFDLPAAPPARNFGPLLSTSGQGPEGPREFNSKELSAQAFSRIDQSETDLINRLYAEEAARKAGPMVPYSYTPNYTTVGEPKVLDAKRRVQDARLQQELNKLIPPSPARDPRIITTGEALTNLVQGRQDEATKASREEAITRRNKQLADAVKIPQASPTEGTSALRSAFNATKDLAAKGLSRLGTKGKAAAGAVGLGAAGTAGYFMLPDGTMAPASPTPTGPATPSAQPTNSNSFFFDIGQQLQQQLQQQPHQPTPTDPELQRLQSLADKRSGGTIWSRDENGRLQATDAFNAPDERLYSLGIQRPASAWYQTGVAEAANPLMAQIAEAAQLDPNAPDSAQTEMALHMGMSQAMESRRAALLQETSATLNLAALEAEVTASISRAQSNPDYVADFGQQDSDETIQAKEALHKAKIQQESLVHSRLQSDPSLMSMNSFLTQTLQARDRQRQVAATQDIKVKEFGQGVNLVGAILNDGAAPPALINANAGKYSELYARMSNPDEFLQAAMDTKIPEARKLAPASFAMRASGSSDPTSPIFKSAQEEAEARIRLLESYTSTGSNLEETFKQSSLPMETLSTYTKAKKMAETVPDAGNLKALEAARLQVSTALVSTQIKNTFEGKVQSWKYPGDNGGLVEPFADSSTPLGKLYQAASSANPAGPTAPVSIANLSTALRSMSLEEQTAVKKAFEEAAAKTLAYSGQLPFGGVLMSQSPKALSDGMVARAVVKDFNYFSSQAALPVGNLGEALTNWLSRN